MRGRVTEWEVILVNEDLVNVGREIVGSDVHGIVGGKIGDVDGDDLVMREDLVRNVVEGVVRDVIVCDIVMNDVLLRDVVLDDFVRDLQRHHVVRDVLRDVVRHHVVRDVFVVRDLLRDLLRHHVLRDLLRDVFVVCSFVWEDDLIHPHRLFSLFCFLSPCFLSSSFFDIVLCMYFYFCLFCLLRKILSDP